MTTSLLPPNATPLERALEGVTARIGDVAAPLDTLLDPALIEAAWLPWLAWALSADSWDADWTEAVKREAVAGSIALHRIKGTRLSVETVLARFDGLARLVEWHETAPPAAPHTFDIVLPMVVDGAAPGGRRATAAFADAIIREVSRVKPLREHLRLVQSVGAEGAVGIEVALRPSILTRTDADLVIDTDPIWAALLQTEQGEPIEDGTGAYLDHRP
jgi:phage tail P2-like protein